MHLPAKRVLMRHRDGGTSTRLSFFVMAEGTSAFLEALAETVCWCATQPLTSEATESAESIRRRMLLGQASDILSRRPAYQSRQWRLAMSLINEASPDSLAPLEHQLRSAALKPEGDIGEPMTDGERASIVSGVVSARSELVSIHEDNTGNRWQGLGKLLIYTPCENVADGASRYASKGLFDANDAPPWDSWVHYSDGELICWIPTALVSLAQDGIDANPVQCIRWADHKKIA